MKRPALYLEGLELSQLSALEPGYLHLGTTRWNLDVWRGWSYGRETPIKNAWACTTLSGWRRCPRLASRLAWTPWSAKRGSHNACWRGDYLSGDLF